MANLVITIISIALVAVAALMGAYYGGNAFIEGQRKALVSSIIESAKQTAAAWHLWVSNHPGSTTLVYPGSDTVIEYNLVPDYLTQTPAFSEAVYPPGLAVARKKFLARCQVNIASTCASGHNVFRLAITPELCLIVSKIAGGDSWTPPRVYPGSYNITNLGKRPFDCIWNDENNDSIMDPPSDPAVSGDDDYLFVYYIS